MDIILLTNRTVQAFDQCGDEMLFISTAFQPNPDPNGKEVERKAIEEIHELCASSPWGDSVHFYVASVRESAWKQEISISEFASLLGHGVWFWEAMNQSHEEYRG